MSFGSDIKMINTLKYAKKLEEVGVPRDQAEAHVQLMTEILEQEFATKSDIVRLENRFDRVESELHKPEYKLIIKLGAICALSISAMVTIQKLF